MSQSILESLNIINGFVPVDLSAAANSGDYISLENYDRILVVLFKAAGTAGEDPTLTLQQASDVSGTGVKALNFTTIHTKQGTLTSVGAWTKVTQTAANTYTDATSAELQAIWAVEVLPADLDINKGFDCIRATVADVGTNGQVGCLFYLARPKKEMAPDTQLSAIID